MYFAIPVMWQSMMVTVELWKLKEADGELPMTEVQIIKQFWQSEDLPDKNQCYK